MRTKDGRILNVQGEGTAGRTAPLIVVSSSDAFHRNALTGYDASHYHTEENQEFHDNTRSKSLEA